jgi:UDP-glucose 4-epimerase
MRNRNVFITGMAGYIGSCLCREMDRTQWCERFYGVDVKPPHTTHEKGSFRQMDIHDPSLGEWIRELRPDILVHLAFVVDPIHQEDVMHRVNVEGTRSILKAVSEAGVPQVLVMSSATAYGAWPDNPVPLKESDPIRRHPYFPYARDKAEVEGICAEFAAEHPDRILSILRPCVVYGPSVDNYISGLFTMPLAIAPTDYAPPFQFVHEDDVARAILCVLEKQGRGPFNLAPSDTMSTPQINTLTNRRGVPMPDWAMKIVFRLAWSLRLPILRVPPSFLDFVRYPWVVDSSRLTDELGFRFRYSTTETLEIMLRAKQVLA